MADMKAVAVETFVEAWQSSATLAECAGRLGVDAKACGQRASWLRGKGVRLKLMFTGAASTLDVEALNALAARHGPLSVPRKGKAVTPPEPDRNGLGQTPRPRPELFAGSNRQLPPLVLTPGARGDRKAAEQRRRELAAYLSTHGPLTTSQIRQAIGDTAGRGTVESLVEHPWFARDSDGYWRVTTEGRRRCIDE